MALSIGFGLVCVLVGLTVSYYADLPPGGTIVLIGTGLLLTTSVVETARR